MTHQKLPPLLSFDDAVDAGHEPFGCCDWGGCDREAWGMRWSKDHNCYLTVCQPCSRSSWRDGHLRRR